MKLLPAPVRLPPDGDAVVLTSEFWMGATARGIASGLRLDGQSVTEVDVDRYFPSGATRPSKVVRRLLWPLAVREYNNALVRAAKEVAAGLFVAVKGDRIRPETFDAAAAAGLTTVVYYPDFHFSYRGFDPEILRRAALVCTTKRFQLPYLDELRGPGRSVLVQHGYVPVVHRPFFDTVSEDEFLYDVSYVGNGDPAKLTWLVRVAEAFPDQRIIVAGHRWSELARGTALERFVHGQAVMIDRLARIHQLSKVNIAVHHGPAGEFGWHDDVSTRTFEIPACRGFMLHVDNDEVRTLFDVPGEIDTFATPAELCEKVGHYLERPDLRRQMVDRAYERAVPHYSYHARAREILNAVRTIRN